MENPSKMDDLGGPPVFLETSMYTVTQNQLSQRHWKTNHVAMCLPKLVPHVPRKTGEIY